MDHVTNSEPRSFLYFFDFISHGMPLTSMEPSAVFTRVFPFIAALYFPVPCGCKSARLQICEAKLEGEGEGEGDGEGDGEEDLEGRMGRARQADRWKVHILLMVVQFTYGVSYVLNKVALNNGMNRIVFSVYRDVVALAVLGPLAYFFERDIRSAAPALRLILLFICLGFTGIFGGQLLLLTGLQLTSSSFVAIMTNATPVVAFTISVLFRLEHIRYKRHDGQAKLTGILACISGAMLISIYKGPVILGSTTTIPLHQQADMHLNNSSASSFLNFNISSWQLGAICLVANSLCLGTYLNLQAPTLSLYPAPISITFFAYLFGAAMLAIFGSWKIQESSSWMISGWTDVLAFVYSGIISSGVNFALMTTCVHLVGPFLVTAYMPMQGVATAILAHIFLVEALYLGNILGALLVVLGLYLVTWGQKKQQQLEACTPKIGLTTDDAQPVIPPKSSFEEPLLG
ncbi:hypothetical protein O6H91_07G068200 [Diphasiastrum complanatum]|uniref:Uncharacterized protein n=1 Tax=Diphasiastrum complanatum TaxID=34168 RepID=A0ACC2D6H9_DIPCM|nr:hypothetical protein O6H91_07G068200 [Diphasiastrum complanatum]